MNEIYDDGCGSVPVTAARIHRLVWTTTGDPDEGHVWSCSCLTDGHFGRNHHRVSKAWAKHVEEAERAAIVAWLRSMKLEPADITAAIERGDHLRGDNAAAALASMTEQRDAARKEAQEAVAGHEKLMEYYVADFSRRMSNNKELRELRKKCSDLSKENEHLSAALNDEKRLDRQEERAAIVAWLRHQSEPGTSAVRPIGSIADQIDNGAHLAGNDE